MPMTKPAAPPPNIRQPSAPESRNNIHAPSTPSAVHVTAQNRHGPDGIFGRVRSRGPQTLDLRRVTMFSPGPPAHRSAGARDPITLRAAVGESVDHRGQIDIDLVGEARHPGEHIAELVLHLFPGALSNRLREFAELLREPCHRVGNAAATVTFAVRSLDDVLQLDQIHAVRP